jgi:indole-3-glycerol phosphate synthase
MTVLDKIISRKTEEIAELRRRIDPATLRARAAEQPSPRSLMAALKACPHVPVIAEIKRASPSEGVLQECPDVASQARSYEKGGAAALSVLTDATFFGGSIEDLTAARNATSLPVLRKDFTLDPIQLYESRIAGADAILLIAAALDPSQLSELFAEAVNLGLTPVVEVHNEQELAPVLDLNPPIVGINNRNLATLEVSLDTCVRVRRLIPPGIFVLGESGIKRPEDVDRLLDAGIDAFLVGTTLMRASDPAAMLATLCKKETING